MLNVFVCLYNYCFDKKSSPFLRPPLTNLRVIKWTTENSAAIELEKSRGLLLIANTQAALDELIAIEHKFLRFVSKRTPVPKRFFDHNYTAIREYLRLPSLRKIYLKNDYVLAFKIDELIDDMGERVDKKIVTMLMLFDFSNAFYSVSL